MKRQRRLLLRCLVLVAVLVVLLLALRGNNFAVFNPAGTVSSQERNLIIFGSLLSLLVVLPVFALTFFIVWRYRVSNPKTKHVSYRPDWDGNRLAEFIWWGFPTILIIILAIITWTSSHNLDPYKALASSNQPLTIQVVALDWKWLFIYPNQNLATVNYVRIPENVPIKFEITSDAPMNSFWIPQLGGQVYAMSGMKTQLNLMANQTGTYRGVSANISGKGFADMRFSVQSTSQASFNAWVDQVHSLTDPLSLSVYATLAQPSENSPAIYYSAVTPSLYDTILMKYMAPTNTTMNSGTSL